MLLLSVLRSQSSLGVPGQFDHPKFIESISRIHEISTKEIPKGIHIIEPDLNEENIELKRDMK